MIIHEIEEYNALLETPEAQKLLLGTGAPWGELPDESPKTLFPVDCFSKVFKEFVIALADSLQVPLDMAGCAVLGALSIACLGTSVRVIPGYSEPTQLYIVIVALPSERKSAVISSVLSPIKEIAKIINKVKSSEKSSSDLQRTILNKQLEKAIGKANESEAESIQKQLDNIPNIRLFSPPLTDATPEALAKAMETNGGTLSYAAAEGNLFNIASGSYSDNPNIDILLQAYSGEPVYIERIGRSAVMIDHTALSILLAVQPQVLERFLSNEKLLERGLCARFLYSMPKSLLESVHTIESQNSLC